VAVTASNGDWRKIALVRAWAITLMGVALIVYGLLQEGIEEIMLGFTVLGTEPMIRAGKQLK